MIMAHYAFLDENGTVTEVIVGKDEGENGTNWEDYYGSIRGKICKRTSYNTYGGVHREGGRPFRKNYAGIGFIYNSQEDAFIPPQPYPSWVLNKETCLWESPIDPPNDNRSYYWDEPSTSWVLLPNNIA